MDKSICTQAGAFFYAKFRTTLFLRVMKPEKIYTFILLATSVGLATLLPSCTKKQFNPNANNPQRLSVYLKLDGNMADDSPLQLKPIAHGTFAATTDRNGKSSGALLFNGKDNYLEIPNHSQFSGSNLTISAWIKPTAFGSYTNGPAVTSSYSGIFCKWDDNSRLGITTYATDKQSRISGYFANKTLYDLGTNTGTFLSINQWQHIAYVFNYNEAKLFLNGTLKAKTTFSNQSGLIQTQAPIEIGRTQWYPSGVLLFSYFTGAMDDLRVYFSALTDTEIKSLSQ